MIFMIAWTLRYFDVLLVEPYLAAKPQQISQRMILPWQTLPSTIDGECSHISQYLVNRLVEHSQSGVVA